MNFRWVNPRRWNEALFHTQPAIFESSHSLSEVILKTAEAINGGWWRGLFQDGVRGEIADDRVRLERYSRSAAKIVGLQFEGQFQSHEEGTRLVGQFSTPTRIKLGTWFEFLFNALIFGGLIIASLNKHSVGQAMLWIAAMIGLCLAQVKYQIWGQRRESMRLARSIRGVLGVTEPLPEVADGNGNRSWKRRVFRWFWQKYFLRAKRPESLARKG